MTTLKVIENRLRRQAARQGLQLSKSCRMDPNALDYGLYSLVDMRTNVLVNPSLAGTYSHTWTLADVEAYLTPKKKRKAKR